MTSQWVVVVGRWGSFLSGFLDHCKSSAGVFLSQLVPRDDPKNTQEVQRFWLGGASRAAGTPKLYLKEEGLAILLISWRKMAICPWEKIPFCPIPSVPTAQLLPPP